MVGEVRTQMRKVQREECRSGGEETESQKRYWSNTPPAAPPDGYPVYFGRL